MERWLGSLVIAAVFGGPSIAWAAEPQDPEQMYLLGATPGVQGSPRVRGSSLEVARAMEDAWEQSPTFRQLVATISATDGIVYVREGSCRFGTRACLAGVAPPIRLVYIMVDPRKALGCELMASLGHELQHALEVLRNPKVIDNHSLAHFYMREGATGDNDRFETGLAVRVGLLVEKELHARSMCRR